MDTLHLTTGTDTLECIYTARIEAWTVDDWTRDTTVHLNPRDLVSYLCIFQQQQQQKKTRAVGGQRARLLGTFYIVTFLSLSHII